MRYLFLIFFVSGLLLMPLGARAEDAVHSDKLTHHEIKVVIDPKKQSLSAEDTITLAGGRKPEFRFLLHKWLKPVSPTQGVRIVRESTSREDAMIESFRVKLPEGLRTFVVKYGGRIYHPLDSGQEQARGFNQTPGVISEEGVFLGGSSFWYPLIEGGLLSFSVEATLPAGWNAVSQGERTLQEKTNDGIRVRWNSAEPQEEIFISAGKLTEYVKPGGRFTAMAFLRAQDKALADKYLEATERYITMYEKLIGPYPYKKFALVENFWETGFGMPSFTLLGSKIIRFPFIITSSYPHEILHNWWGNSVFPDFRNGNWSEGLTAYLSDHLIKEQQGGGVEYRKEVLQKYADYVLDGRDFPLTEFRSRHSPSTEAVGYGKSLMFFHMLRRRLGDATFREGLRDFYREKKFGYASYADIRKSLEKISGKDLRIEFNEWILRSGAPELRLRNLEVRKSGEDYILTALMEQVQEGDSYHLSIPIAITMEGKEWTYQTVLEMDKKSLEFSFQVPSRPLRVDVDSEFDLFRRLDLEETPPAISKALGAKKMLVILPSSANPDLLMAYKKFGADLKNFGPDEIEFKLDKNVGRMPSDRAVAVLGWGNLFFEKLASELAAYGVSVSEKSIKIGQAEIPKERHSFVLSTRNPDNKEMGVIFIAADSPDALPGLGRKLPHYHKYSYLGFEGDEPANIAKGKWPVLDSPMTIFLPGSDGMISKVGMAKLSPREPLIAPQQVFSKERMIETIGFLSGDELKGRGLGTEELDRASSYIAERFRDAGLKPGGDTEGSYYETWEESGGDPERKVTMKNVIGVIPGRKAEFSGQSIVIGAHYDHLGLGWPDVREENKGKIHHGADDNASGVSVLIELARIFKDLNPDRSVIFVAFTGEEAGRRGSKYYVANQKKFPAGKCFAMLNLDTVGRLGRKKLLILGSESAGEWAHIFRGAGFVTGIETDMVSENLDSSDHVSFQEAGIPAAQLFSGPNMDYHRPTDTIDKIDADGLVKVASISKEVIEYLASREEPLTTAFKKDEDRGSGMKKERKSSLGTIPDFAYRGRGCRLTGVVAGSPAETCGLKEGDIIFGINGEAINGLKDLSNILKSLAPGSRISITFLRDGKEMTAEAEVRAR